MASNAVNGVALAPDESCVAVAETGAFSVSRVRLSDGHRDMLVEDLWGFPDNTSTGTDGLTWIRRRRRVAALDVVRRCRRSCGRHPGAPRRRCSQTGREVGVLGVAPDGKVEREFRGEIPGFHILVGVREWRGKLYFGSLAEAAVAVTAALG